MNEQAYKPDDGSQSAANRAPLKPAYLILGDDLPKVEYALKRLKSRIVEQSGSDLNIDEFDAGEHDALQVVNAANTMAFLGGTRLVLVQNAQVWLKADKSIVVGYLEAPAPDACLALVAEKVPPGDVLRLAMEKHGEVLEFRAPREGELPQWLVREAGRRGLRLGLNEARFMVRRCGDDQSILLRDLEKLQIYAAGQPVSVDDIRLLTTATIEASVFDLLDSLALGRGGAVFSAADDLLASGERVEVLFYRILQALSEPQPGGGLPGGGHEPGGHSGRAQDEGLPHGQVGGASGPAGCRRDRPETRHLGRHGCPHEGVRHFAGGDGAAAMSRPDVGRLSAG